MSAEGPGPLTNKFWQRDRRFTHRHGPFRPRAGWGRPAERAGRGGGGPAPKRGKGFPGQAVAGALAWGRSLAEARPTPRGPAGRRGAEVFGRTLTYRLRARRSVTQPLSSVRKTAAYSLLVLRRRSAGSQPQVHPCSVRMLRIPDRSGEAMGRSSEEIQNLKSRIAATLANGHLNAWQTKFLTDIRRRLEQYGPKTVLSDKQVNKLNEVIGGEFVAFTLLRRTLCARTDQDQVNGATPVGFCGARVNGGSGKPKLLSFGKGAGGRGE